MGWWGGMKEDPHLWSDSETRPGELWLNQSGSLDLVTPEGDSGGTNEGDTDKSTSGKVRTKKPTTLFFSDTPQFVQSEEQSE